MPEYTTPYGLSKLGPGESFSENGYKYTIEDRDVIARLLQLGAESHRHTGGLGSLETPDSGPLLAVNTSGGSLTPGTRFYYKYTLVNPDGFESAASPQTFIDTAASITSPSQATNPVVAPTGGTLPPGNYYYLLSAYTGTSSQETIASNALYVSIPYSTTTNKVTFNLPALPTGSTGFNVYRRTPSGVGYLHVATIDMSGVPPTTFVDNGSLVEDCDRFAPTTSTALSNNSVIVSLPETLPVGYSWRVYRSRVAGVFSNSLVATVTATNTYTDVGNSTTLGQPPTAGVAPGSPSKILLTNAAEVTGTLPMGLIAAFPNCETFSYPGPLVPLVGSSIWVCPFPNVQIVSVRASLGRDSTPDAQPVQVQVNKKANASSTYLPMFDSDNLVEIAIGEQIGLANSTFEDSLNLLEEGDALTVDIVQNGGGSDTDRDLTVTIYMYAYGYSTTSSDIS